MVESKLHKCPVCATPLEVDLKYEVENIEPESIIVCAYCPRCKSAQCEDIDYSLERLAAKVGYISGA